MNLRLRPPDQLIGGDDQSGPYMRRWWLFGGRKHADQDAGKGSLQVYLHNFLRSDRDRALHDHPSWNLSIVLWGGYYEITPDWAAEDLPGFKADRANLCAMVPDAVARYPLRIRWRGPGSIVFRRAWQPHRIAVGFNPDGTTMRHAPRAIWSLWIRGRTSREWGFFANGWTHWRKFSA